LNERGNGRLKAGLAVILGQDLRGGEKQRLVFVQLDVRDKARMAKIPLELLL
jgi:hypothetical protein